MMTIEEVDAAIAELESSIALSAEEEADPKTKKELEEFDAWQKHHEALNNYYAALAKVPEKELEEFIYGPERAAALAVKSTVIPESSTVVAT